MDKFKVQDKVKEIVNGNFVIQQANWSDAYADIPGKQAYEDGWYTGGHNMYVEACYNLVGYFKKITEETPNIKLKDCIKLIDFSSNKK